MKKRLLSAALVLCLLLALLPMAAFADDDVQTGTCGDGLTWTLDAAGTLTVTGSGVISANAFAFNSKIVRAEIGAGVTGIGLGAFFKCANLEAVTLPAGLTTLGTAAFAYCEKLASVTLPGSLKSTGGGAFQGCTALTAVTILPGVHIGRCAVIGAGSVVTGDVEAYHIYAGVPARKIRDIRTGERVQ